MALPFTRRTGKDASAAEIKDKFEKGQRDTTRETARYWINASFVEGEQWVAWSRKENRLEQVPKPAANRVRFTDNRVGPDSETVLAKLLRRPLTFEVPPTAADDSAVQGAKKASDVLADLHRAHDWEQLREEHAWAVWKGATAGLCVEWDPGAGRTVRPGSDDAAEVREGDTVESALTICEMVTEPGVRDIERARWWIKVAALTPAEARERYGLDFDPPADFTGAMSPLQRLLVLGRTDSAPAELCQVLTYFERPNPQNRQGRVAVVVGDRIVDEGVWPFPFTDRLNLVVTVARPINGRWCGACRLTDAIEVQTALNVVWSSVVEHRKLAGNARLFVDEMSLDNIEYLSDLPGEIVPLRQSPSGFKPDWLTPPSMTGHFEEIERLRAEIDDILGVHDVSRGDAPGSVDSGVGLRLLAEQDDTPIGSLSRRLGDAWGRFASLVLATLEAKVTSPRNGRVEFDGLPPFAFQWSGADLAGQTTAIVPADVISTESKAGRFERAVLMWDKGMFGSPGDPKAFARYCDLPGGASLIEAMDPDEVRAREENHRLSLGMPEVPMVEDDHNTHVGIHLAYVKSAGFRLLPEETQAMVREHLQAHEVLSAEELGSQLARGRVSPVLPTVASATGAPAPDFSEGVELPAVPEGPVAEPGIGDAAVETGGVA